MMDLEAMKNIWAETANNQQIGPFQTNEIYRHTYKSKINVFRTGEIIGLGVAYTLAGCILYKFNVLDNWYLRLCGIILMMYLLVMPLYTYYGFWKMKHIDLGQSDYKTLLEHFYLAKRKLKLAEKISFVASPFLFFVSIVILTKIFKHENLFSLNIPLPAIILIGVSFILAVFFNFWAFKKRDKQLKSVQQLLEE